MKYSVALVVVALGCQQRPTERAIVADLVVDAVAVPDVEDTAPVVTVADAASVDGDVGVADAPVAVGARARFVTLPLTKADHGIDGSFELWRDKRLDDKQVADLWFTGAFSHEEAPDTFNERRPLTAQLVLRERTGRVVESLDLELPLARTRELRLGDDAVPYIEVDIDTFAGVGRWGGTTTKFVRVEGGHSNWLPCVVVQCTMGCRWGTDARRSGGYDLLTASQSIAGTADSTVFERIEVVGGRCVTSTRSVPGWGGEVVPWPAPSAFPARTGGR